MEDVLGVKCNFETACAWMWDESVLDGFQTVTGANLTESNRTGIMPGPPADSRNDANGNCAWMWVYGGYFVSVVVIRWLWRHWWAQDITADIAGETQLMGSWLLEYYSMINMHYGKRGIAFIQPYPELLFKHIRQLLDGFPMCQMFYRKIQSYRKYYIRRTCSVSLYI